MTCKKFFLLLVFSFGFVCLGAEPWYRVSESQLQRIEQSLEKLETDRRNWELQARGLRNEAASLNDQLRAERERYSALETSFNRYEDSQQTVITQARNREKEVLAELSREKLRTKSVENQRNILGGVIVLFLIISIGIVMIRKKLKPP